MTAPRPAPDTNAAEIAARWAAEPQSFAPETLLRFVDLGVLA